MIETSKDVLMNILRHIRINSRVFAYLSVLGPDMIVLYETILQQVKADGILIRTCIHHFVQTLHGQRIADSV